jgi:hypothetical protein
MLRECIGAESLARLGTTQTHHVLTGWCAPKVVVESDDAVNLGPRDIQPLGDQRHRCLRDVSEGGLDGMQYFQ